MARRQFTRNRSARDRGDGLLDEVLKIRVHTKVTKGGRTVSFGALVAVGDGKGKVGLGYGKARGVPMAIEKAIKDGKRDMITVSLTGDTVCHEQIGEHKSSRVLLKPAARGTGVKAGSTVRNIMTVLGVRNVLAKSLGRNNALNLAKATMQALRDMRSTAEVERLRGVRIALKHPQIAAEIQTPPETRTAAEVKAPVQAAVEQAEQEAPAPPEATAAQSDEPEQEVPASPEAPEQDAAATEAGAENTTAQETEQQD